MLINKRQNGFSLVELMISITVGMLVLAGVVKIFSDSMGSNVDTLKTTRLNQELRAIMDIMSNDIRRAGYWAGAAAVVGANNPFSTITINGTNDCILYSYDEDSSADAAVPSTEQLGFRLNAGAIEMRSNAALCDAGGWQDLSDSNAITITALNFNNAATQCLNLSNSTDSDCIATPALAGDTTVTVREIEITLTGQLSGDATVTRTLQQTVRIRNDAI